jgi:5'(3')-deoxyribonucleotidase
VNKTILLDMDGVLVDFHAGAFKAHGVSVPRKDLRWDFWKALGITDKDFYAPLGREFWAELPWTGEGPRLLRLLERLVPRERIVILTAPVDTAGCYDGKVDWIRRHIPEYQENFLVGPAKFATSHVDSCLIDDRDKNCVKFTNEKGTAILVPRPWNVLRTLTDENGSFKVKYVIDQVKRFIGA